MLLLFWLFTLLCATGSPSPVDGPAVSDPTTTVSSLTQAAGWQYQQTVEPSTGTTYKASLNAANLLQLAYPYEGGSTVTLTIRNRGGNTNAYLSVSKGMFAPSFQGGKALIRFDEGRSVTYSLTAAANGRGNLLFIDDEKRLIQQIRTSRTMAVQIKMVGQNLNEMRFNSAGLRWNH